MTVFVDTSALYALLDADDDNHAVASTRFAALRDQELVSHSYVLVETLALVGRRLPWAATETFVDTMLPLIDVQVVTADLHQAALAGYRASGAARVSFVDQASFAFMREHDIGVAFAFDADFERHGFTLLA